MSASGTAFTLGTGGYWKEICSGKHDELDEKGALASCTMFILGFEAGAILQARESKTTPTLCRSLNPNKLPAEYVTFVNSNKKYEEMNVLDVLLEFTKDDKCDV
ncbi:hypothetical protein [Aliikangiella maris]|uniref:Rap1a immunity protein domain-containing protein n=2 Tax=Aliikangiella maris TaxID=3162458 RepID=A0ABV2C072_9GAMM